MTRVPIILLGAAFVACQTVPPAGGAQASLSVEPGAAAPGDSVVLVLVNGSAEQLGYNLCTSGLERRTGDGWQHVPDDRVCTMELRTLEPGNDARYTLALPAQLPPGEYRAVTGVERMAQGDRVGVATEPFTVTP